MRERVMRSKSQLWGMYNSLFCGFPRLSLWEPYKHVLIFFSWIDYIEIYWNLKSLTYFYPLGFLIGGWEISNTWPWSMNLLSFFDFFFGKKTDLFSLWLRVLSILRALKCTSFFFEAKVMAKMFHSLIRKNYAYSFNPILKKTCLIIPS